MYRETNNTIIEIKNTLEGINSRISEAEERISELEDKMVEITSEEHNKVKRMKRTEDSLRYPWDNIKHTIWIIGVPEEEAEKAMATHSSTLAWKIPWMGEPGGLPSMGLHRVRHDWSNLAAAAEEEKKKDYENIFEEIRVENFPNMEKKIVNQI